MGGSQHFLKGVFSVPSFYTYSIYQFLLSAYSQGVESPAYPNSCAPFFFSGRGVVWGGGVKLQLQQLHHKKKTKSLFSGSNSFTGIFF